MNRKRLSRMDSRDQTRQRLLDAAQKLVSKKGLDATSVEDITDAAGYSRGAFYSNFDTKHMLFIELLRRDHEKATTEFIALMRDEIPDRGNQNRHPPDLFKLLPRPGKFS